MHEPREEDPVIHADHAEELTVAPRRHAPVADDGLVLYVVLRGAFALSSREAAPRERVLPLSRTDVVVAPPGASVTLRCEGDEPGELLRAVYAKGRSELEHVRVAHAAASTGRLRTLVRLVRAELREGDREMAARLLDPLLAYAARASEDGAAELLDSVVADAVARLRERPDHPWTVDELAKQAGLSRSAFTRRFTREVGASPLRWLATWRMQLAARRLAEGDDSLAQIAAEVGYESEFSFSRAFKRHHGVPPGTFRRRHHGLRRRDEPMLRAA